MRDYIAFISYRHKPLDMAVAKKLHRLIEKYRVPSDIVNRGHSRRLGYVFRDQDELPVSSDLSSDIKAALDRSTFLIVVCTPDTPQSPWVNREIEYFLNNHPRENILAVLASGTPQTSFPKLLTEVRTDDGRILQEIEPLAANIVGKNRIDIFQKLNAEKLRLFAALIGCSYDELQQRMRKYRRTKNIQISAVVGSVVIAFISLLLVKNYEITQKNVELQLSESESLALSADLLLDRGDTVGAIEYAIKALPSKENERPYVAQAEQVLYDIIEPYTVGKALPERILQQESSISQLVCSNEGEYVITIDNYGMINAYSSETGQVIWTSTIPSEDFWPSVSLYYSQAHNTVLAVCNETIVAFNVYNGIELWRYTINSSMYSISAISGDGRLFAIADHVSNYNSADIEKLCFLSVENGKELGNVHWTSDNESYNFWDENNTKAGVFSESNEYYLGVNYPYGDNNPSFFIVDLNSLHVRVIGTEICIDASDNPTTNIKVVGLYCNETDMTASIAMVNNNTEELILSQISMETAEEIYRTVAPISVSYATTDHSAFLCTNSSVFVSVSNDLFVFDRKNGKYIAASIDNSADFLYLLNPSNEDSAILIINSNGWYGICSVSDSIYFSNFDGYYLNLGNTEMAALGNDGCIAFENRLVSSGIDYSFDIVDDGFVAVVSPEHKNQVQLYRVQNDRGLIEDSLSDNNNDGNDMALFGIGGYWYTINQHNRIIRNRYSLGMHDITAYDLDTRNEQFNVPDGYSNMYDEHIFTSDGLSYICCGDEYFDLVLWNTKTGKTEKLTYRSDWIDEYGEQHSEEFSPSCYYSDSAYRASGTITATFDEYADNADLIWWLDGKQQENSTCPYINSDLHWNYSFVDCSENGYILLPLSGTDDNTRHGFALFSTENKGWNYIPHMYSQEPDTPVYMAKNKPIFATMGSKNILYLYDIPTGECSLQIEMPVVENGIQQLAFFNNDKHLYLLTGDDHLYIYSTEDGALCFEHHYESACNYNVPLSCYTSKDGKLVFCCFADGNADGLMIELDTWTRIATIPHLIAYDRKSNEIFLRASTSFDIYSFQLLTTDALVKQAERIIIPDAQ